MLKLPECGIAHYKLSLEMTEPLIQFITLIKIDKVLSLSSNYSHRLLQFATIECDRKLHLNRR